MPEERQQPNETMTGRQQPRPGDIAVSAADRAIVHGAPLGAVEVDFALPTEADLSNVVLFTRARRPDGEGAPLVPMHGDARPAPMSPERKRRLQLIAFAVFSLAVHAALYVVLMQEPRALASVGIETINVEIVLGANTPAGLAAAQGENHEQAPAQEQQTPRPEQQQAETAMAAPASPQGESSETAAAVVAPSEQATEPEQPAAARQPAPPKPKQTDRAPAGAQARGSAQQ